MAENNVQNVKIVTTEMNLRATSLRARISDVIAIRKCGSAQELGMALAQLEYAYDQFKDTIIHVNANE